MCAPGATSTAVHIGVKIATNPNDSQICQQEKKRERVACYVFKSHVTTGEPIDIDRAQIQTP